MLLHLRLCVLCVCLSSDFSGDPEYKESVFAVRKQTNDACDNCQAICFYFFQFPRPYVPLITLSVTLSLFILTTVTRVLYYSVSQKRPRFIYMNNTIKNKPILMIFGVLNPGKIWNEHLTLLSTLPVRYSHFTLGNQKVFFNSVHIHFCGWLGSRVVSVLTHAQKGLGSNHSRDAIG